MFTIYFMITYIVHTTFYFSYTLCFKKNTILTKYFILINIMSFLISSFKRSYIKQDMTDDKYKIRIIKDISTCDMFLDYCYTCNVFTNTHIVHCFQCNSCILKKDHHCLWLDNCIGAENRIFYLIYLATTVFLLFDRMIFFYKNCILFLAILLFIFIYLSLTIIYVFMLFSGTTTRVFVKTHFLKKKTSFS